VCADQVDVFASAELDWLPGHWTDATGGDELTFERSPRYFVQHVRRQVGNDDDPAVPYPTTCTFERSSTSFCVWKQPEGSQYPFGFQFRVSDIELIADPNNDTACGAFISEAESKIAASVLAYSDQFGQAPDGKLDMDGTLLEQGN
jgi:hypothetical protein